MTQAIENAEAGKEEPPLSELEFLLRRFLSDPGQWDFTGGFIRLSVFLPGKADVDGLSFYRELLMSAEELRGASINEKVRKYAGVAALRMDRLKHIGLNPIIKPDELPGHVIVPELNRKTYDTAEGKKIIKELADRIIREKIAEIRLEPIPIPKE